MTSESRKWLSFTNTDR